MNDTRSREAAGVLAVLTGAFLVVLSFDWAHVGVGMRPLVSLHVSTSGWDGWGLVAGLTAVGLLLYLLLEVAGHIPQDQGTEIPPAVLGLVVCLATIAKFHSLASVNVMSAVLVEHTWAATAGLVLSVVIAAVGLGRLVLRGPAFSGRSHPAH
jgi:hypothetical protein